eukprot:GILJ01018502.1.p1 GENE.GILJ01018502.1~~GILJ01018502.1.p1  ORF type:complete len:570 (-),score=44.02 GILJ01018502.1:82-1707(-)
MGFWLSLPYTLFLAAVEVLKWLIDVVTKHEPKRHTDPLRIAVIGGGIAGSGCAWSLRRSGFDVTLFEARDQIGGNAKTHLWRDEEIRTGLSVLAWPPQYFHNYTSLLRTLGVDSESVSLPFMVGDDDHGVFAHDMDTNFKHKLQSDIKRWRWLVCFVRYVTWVFNGSHSTLSLYRMNILNPFNYISLRSLSRVFRISSCFWDSIVVPIYSSTFLTVRLDNVPAIIVPIVDDLISVTRTPVMQTWSDNSSLVFSRLTKGVNVKTAVDLTRVFWQYKDGQQILVVEDAHGSRYTFDKVVFACSADNAKRLLSTSASSLQAHLLSHVQYTDDDDMSFAEGVIHNDASVLPAQYNDVLSTTYSNYVRVRRDPSEGTVYDNTFILSSWVPAVQRAMQQGKRLSGPMLVTYSSDKHLRIDKSRVQGTVSNLRAHPHLSVQNLALSSFMRFAQGQQNMYFCGSYTTPGNGHDLSFLSGLVVASAIGAVYPFDDCVEAKDDFKRLQGLMGLKSTREGQEVRASSSAPCSDVSFTPSLNRDSEIKFCKEQ